MAINRDTLRIFRQLIVGVGAETDAVTRSLTQSWTRAWDELATGWRTGMNDAVEVAMRTGAWPPPWELQRIQRLGSAMGASEDALVQLGKRAGVSITDGAGRVVRLDVDAEPRLIASQVPAALAPTVSATVAGNVLPDALDTIVARTAGQVTSAMLPLSAQAADAMRRELVRGVAVGDNPRTVAARMVSRVQGQFEGGLTRAVTIARTEMLDAYRAAAAHTHAVNADVLAGWQWWATLDKRTCPACWSMHGKTFPLAVPGPWDHQQGRCARLPKTRSWADLGIRAPEPPDVGVDARAKFFNLPPASQLAIMGRGRLGLLQSGAIDWDDLALLRHTPAWRSAYYPRSVSDLRQVARGRQLRGQPPSPLTGPITRAPGGPMPPAGLTDAQKRAWTRARYAEVQAVKGYAEAASQVDEWINNYAGVAPSPALRSNIDNFVGRFNIDRAVVDEWLEVFDNQGLEALGLRTMADAAARGLRPIGRAGEVVAYDLKLHEPIASGMKLRAGEPVEVVRPGFMFKRTDTDDIRLFRATVDETDEIPFTTRLGKAATDEDALRSTPASLVRIERAGPGGSTQPVNYRRLTQPERKALRDYQSSYGYAVLGQLRRAAELGEDLSTGVARTVRHIDRVMDDSPLKRDVVVWRGSKTGRPMFGDALDGDLTGAEWTEHAYVATSASRKVARGFTYPGATDEPVMMRMLVPKGVNATQISRWTEGTGAGPDQAELLLRRGLKLRVVKDNGIVDGVRQLDVEVIPAKAAAKLATPIAPSAGQTLVQRAAAKIEIRDSLKAARNADDLATIATVEYRRLTGRSIFIDLPKGASVQTAREHLEGILRVAEDFPEVDLRRLGHFTTPDATYAQAKFWQGDIEFASQWLGTADRAKYLRNLRNDVDAHWSPAGMENPAAVAMHEFGHVLSMGYLNGAADADVLKALDDYAAKITRPGSDPVIARQVASQLGVSRYAATNVDELIAEALADVYMNGRLASSLSREIVYIVGRHYDAKVKGIAPTPITRATGRAAPKKAAPLSDLPADLTKMTVVQLKAVAKTRGVALKSTDRKADIIAKLKGGPPPAAVPPPLAKMTVPQLKILAKDRGIKVAAKDKKADLIAKLSAKAEPTGPQGADAVRAGDFNGLTRTADQTAGTNPGGMYQASDGSMWYVKAVTDAEHANNESLVAALYRAAGIDVPEIVRGSGAPGLSGDTMLASRVATRARVGIDPLGEPEMIASLREGFAVDAWLANWDVMGAGYGNIARVGLSAQRIDVGGASIFRGGVGLPKGTKFGTDVPEWKTLRDPARSSDAARIYSTMTPAELRKAVDRVKAVTPTKIRALVKQSGMPSDLADILIARRADVLDQLKKELAVPRIPTPIARAREKWDRQTTTAKTDQAGLDQAPLQVSGSTWDPHGLTFDGFDAAFPNAATRADITDALKRYRDDEFKPINGLLRGTPFPGVTQSITRRFIDRIQSAMRKSKLRESVVVWRGVKTGESVFGPRASWPADLTGAEWSDPAFFSTSVDRPKAEDFADRVLMRFIFPKDTPAIQLSGYEYEAELMIGPGYRFRVIRDHGSAPNPRKGGTVERLLDVEVLPPARKKTT